MKRDDNKKKTELFIQAGKVIESLGYRRTCSPVFVSATEVETIGFGSVISLIQMPGDAENVQKGFVVLTDALYFIFIFQFSILNFVLLRYQKDN